MSKWNEKKIFSLEFCMEKVSFSKVTFKTFQWRKQYKYNTLFEILFFPYEVFFSLLLEKRTNYNYFRCKAHTNVTKFNKPGIAD